MDEFATAPSFAQARSAVAFWDLGEGTPVLVLHGFPDAPIGMSPLVDRLVKAGDIPCFKLPGGVLFRVDALRDWAHQMELRAVQRSESPEIPMVSKPDTNGEAFTRSP